MAKYPPNKSTPSQIHTENFLGNRMETPSEQAILSLSKQENQEYFGNLGYK